MSEAGRYGRYSGVISVIVGVTNIIPFFGPFIGAIPSALLILVDSPVKALHFCDTKCVSGKVKNTFLTHLSGAKSRLFLPQNRIRTENVQ